TTTSAAWTWSPVSGLGNSRDRSRPISAIACKTAGWIWLAGCDPADVTRTRPRASSSSRGGGLWDRPALWTQTNSTCGTSVMAPRSAAGSSGGRRVGWRLTRAAAGRPVLLAMERLAVAQNRVDLPRLAVGRALHPELVLLGVAAGRRALIHRGQPS